MEICSSSDCTHAASSMLNKMNNSAQPCDDFYNFVCGQFINDADEKLSVTSFSVIEEKVENQIVNMLEEPIDKNDIKPFKLVKSFYEMCLTEGKIRFAYLMVNML